MERSLVLRRHVQVLSQEPTNHSPGSIRQACSWPVAWNHGAVWYISLSRSPINQRVVRSFVRATISSEHLTRCSSTSDHSTRQRQDHTVERPRWSHPQECRYLGHRARQWNTSLASNHEVLPPSPQRDCPDRLLFLNAARAVHTT